MRKLLIANRGEIACRIARTARRLGLGVATVHSSADRGALHVREIGESIEVGAAPAGASYLNIEAILAAAARVGADAVHPGYGFLSENAAFVRAVEAAGLVFIGPTAETLERVGGKASAKREAARLGLPVIEGSERGLVDVREIAEQVRAMRLPVLLKAVAGGGGRGMAVIEHLEGLQARIESAMREAGQGFGSGELIVERYLPRVRHVEVQIAGDGHGAAIHLYERECTLQRRHQKLLEEAPAAALPAALVETMRADACRLAAAVAYRGLGTVEFVVAGDRHHFLEVNPRLQVEHPVTEAVTGLDLVELQLRIADTGRLPLAQADVRCSGHAFEARLCAEDPAQGFLPATGRIAVARFPGAPLRVEAGVASGDEVTPHYDSMIAKLIAAGPTREAARATLLSALGQTRVLGVVTNLAFLQELLAWPETVEASFHTRLIDERCATVQGFGKPAEPAFALRCAAALLWLEQQRAATPALGCWSDAERFTGWRLGHGAEAQPASQPSLRLRCGDAEWPVRFSPRAADGAWRVAVGDRVGRVALDPLGTAHRLLHADGATLELTVAIDGARIELAGPDGQATFECAPWVGGDAVERAPGNELAAPMMGKVVAIRAGPGDRVVRGQTVIVLESMKMELHVDAPFDATVGSIRCALGEMVARGAVLADVSAEEPAEAPTNRLKE
jgi:3-methylcrotonyl-CoA carboxylase alpha subunit